MYIILLILSLLYCPVLTVLSQAQCILLYSLYSHILSVFTYCSTQAQAQAQGQGQAEPEMALNSLVPGAGGAGGSYFFQEMLNSSSAPEIGWGWGWGC